MKVNKIAIVWAGLVGTALAYLLKEKGYTLVGMASRREESLKKAASLVKGDVRTTTAPEEITAQADLVFMTTSDSAIQEVCDRIASKGGFHPGQIVVHTSGALPSTILKNARDRGALIASVHPLQSFADFKEAVKLIPS
ncbi:MAG: NAD(P)-binding domain-containing protein, partial [Desulfobacterales bacterium]|nr:NAD(P)-binding domain-containing protein [Desulfobacterales bacterium]